jgi:hypothetical protein
MSPQRPSRRKNERGAITIHVAIALMALLVFTSFVIDYGVMWVSRRQAQNVADSGALAGALAMIFDGGSDLVVNQAAQHWAANNPIWGQGNSALNVEVTLSSSTVNIPPCGAVRGCVRVDVMRKMPDRQGVLRGNAIPTYFAQLVGRSDQGVRATATAETAAGNQIKCMLPFAVADRWADWTDPAPDTTTYLNDDDHLSGDPIGGWSPNDLYEDGANVPPGLDTYAAPLPNTTKGIGPGTHTGWTVAGDFGRQLVLKDGEVGQFSAGWANKVDLPGSVGSADYRLDIKQCNDTPVGIAQVGETCAGYPNSGTTVPEAAAGCLGVSSGLTVGPTEQGVDGGGPGGLSVLEQDPSAIWSTAVNGGPPGTIGAVVKSSLDSTLNMASDRIRPIAIFDIAHYMLNPGCVNQAGTGCVIRVANIVGFFVEGMCDDVDAAGLLEDGVECAPNPEGRNQVVGRIVTLPAKFIAGYGAVAEDAAFLMVVRLVR